MSRCVIIGGAEISDYDWVRSHLEPDDFAIFCDSGLRHREALCLTPNLVVGDFDSWPHPHNPQWETLALPREKDDTDTVFAAREAVRRGFEHFLLLGVIGARLDHTLGNVAILLMLDGLGKRAMILDDYSEMEIVSKNPAQVDRSFPYFSLLNISGVARGVTIEDAKYPLYDAEIPCDYPYGISNEVLNGKESATISVQEGRLLLVRVRASAATPPAPHPGG